MTERRSSQRQIGFATTWLVTAAVATVVAGCSRSIDAIPVEVAPVEGTLNYRGQPVPEALLTFRGDDASEPAFAVTDLNGKFQCMTNDSSAGMPPGDYIVTISSPRVAIPERYAANESTPLRVSVEESGDNQLRLELED